MALDIITVVVMLILSVWVFYEFVIYKKRVDRLAAIVIHPVVIEEIADLNLIRDVVNVATNESKLYRGWIIAAAINIAALSFSLSVLLDGGTIHVLGLITTALCVVVTLLWYKQHERHPVWLTSSAEAITLALIRRDVRETLSE